MKGLQSRRRSCTKKRFLTGRQVSWMICEYFTFSDTDESVLDLSEFKKVEWKMTTFSRSTRYGTKPESRRRSSQTKKFWRFFVNIVSFVVHCKVQFNKVHRESASDFKKMVANTREKHFSDLEKACLCRKCSQGTDNQKGQCSRGDQCGNESTILRERCENPKGKKERVRDPPALRDEILWDKEQRPAGREKPANVLDLSGG